MEQHGFILVCVTFVADNWLWLFTCHLILKSSSFLGPVSLGRGKQKRVDRSTKWLLKLLLRCSTCYICLYCKYIKQNRMVPCHDVLGMEAGGTGV